jgi:Mg2+ and Co2+ transporter CorA
MIHRRVPALLRRTFAQRRRSPAHRPCIPAVGLRRPPHCRRFLKIRSFFQAHRRPITAHRRRISALRRRISEMRRAISPLRRRISEMRRRVLS